MYIYIYICIHRMDLLAQELGRPCDSSLSLLPSTHKGTHKGKREKNEHKSAINWTCWFKRSGDPAVSLRTFCLCVF